MEPYSRSTSPPNQPPRFLARIVNELQRDRIYKERAPFFNGGLTEEQYFRKIRVLDSYPVSTATKSVWALTAVDKAADSDFLASVEVFVRDIAWRQTPESPTITRKAAFLASLFVPERHRGHGYARQLLHHVVGALRARHFPAPLDDVAFVYAACAPDKRSIFRGCQWHSFAEACWKTVSPPKFSSLGPLQPTAPIYEHELASYVTLVTERAERAVDSHRSCRPTFAFKISDEQIKYRLAHHRINWKMTRPDEDRPLVVGARIGTLARPSSMPFILWSLIPTINQLSIIALSPVCETAIPALCAAADGAAQDLRASTVYLRLTDPGRLAKVIDFTHDEESSVSIGTLLIGTEQNDCDWVAANRTDTLPSSGT